MPYSPLTPPPTPSCPQPLARTDVVGTLKPSITSPGKVQRAGSKGSERGARGSERGERAVLEINFIAEISITSLRAVDSYSPIQKD